MYKQKARDHKFCFKCGRKLSEHFTNASYSKHCKSCGNVIVFVTWQPAKIKAEALNVVDEDEINQNMQELREASNPNQF